MGWDGMGMEGVELAAFECHNSSYQLSGGNSGELVRGRLRVADLAA